MLLAVFVRTGDRWSMITSATRDHIAAAWGRGVLFAVLAVAAILAALWLGRRWGALLLAARRRRGAPRARAVRHLREASRSVRRRRLDAVCPDRAGEDPHARVFGLDGKLYPNTAGALGLQDVRALDALYVERYLRYVKTFIAPRIFDRFTGTELPVVYRDNPMFDALSVRAVLSQHALAPRPGLRLLGRDRTTRVYENANAYPRAWVVHDVHSSKRGRGLRLSRGHARRRTARLSSRVSIHGASGRRDTRRGSRTTCWSRSGRPVVVPGCGQDDVTVERYSANSVTLRVAAACEGLLVLPDVYFPGWTRP